MARRNQYGQFVPDDDDRTRRGRTRYEEDDREREFGRGYGRRGESAWDREERQFGSQVGTRRRYDEEDEGDRFGVWRGEHRERGLRGEYDRESARMSGGRGWYEDDDEPRRFGRGRRFGREEYPGREDWNDTWSRRSSTVSGTYPYEGEEYGRYGDPGSRWTEGFTGPGSFRRGVESWQDRHEREGRRARVGGGWRSGGRDFDDDDEDRYGYGRGGSTRRVGESGWGRSDFDEDYDDRFGRGRSGTSRRGFPSIDPDEQRIIARTGGEVHRGQR